MFKKYTHILLLAALPFFISGCYTLGLVDIEVIKPAKITLPPQINSLLIINNSLVYPLGSFKNDIQKGLYKLDTTTTQMVVRQINDIVNESPRFDTSILINDIYFRKAKDLLKPIEWNNVNSLCTKYQTDALVSLEAFGIIDTIVRNTYFDGYGYTTYKTLGLITNSLWRIYLADEQKILEKRIQRDTLFIDEVNSKKEYLNAVTQQKAINYLAKKMAQNTSTQIADRMAPYWLRVQRDFFINGNTEMQKAASLAYADNWRAAALIWNPLTKNENKKLSAVACYNMALACEVEGKLDIALLWLNESIKNIDLYASQIYIKLILLRIEESAKLDKQFGVNN